MPDSELRHAIIHTTKMKDPHKSRPPFLLHLLAGFFVIAGIVNITGIIQVVDSWNWLLASGYYPHPVYAVFKGTFIASGCLVAGASLWARRAWSPRFGQVMTCLVILWFWVDRVLLTRNPQPFAEHLFPLLICVMVGAFVLVSLWLLQPWMKTPPGTELESTELENE